jgi:hypothetical protein
MGGGRAPANTIRTLTLLETGVIILRKLNWKIGIHEEINYLSGPKMVQGPGQEMPLHHKIKDPTMDKQACKVFVGDLRYDTTDAKLRTYFMNYGTVVEATVSDDKETGRSRGVCFCVFAQSAKGLAAAAAVVRTKHVIDQRQVRLLLPCFPVPPAGRCAPECCVQQFFSCFAGERQAGILL